MRRDVMDSLKLGEITGMAGAMYLYIPFLHAEHFFSSTGRKPQGRCAEDFCY
jgi:hypothetical protein